MQNNFNFSYPNTVFSADGSLSSCDNALKVGLQGTLCLGINSPLGSIITTSNNKNKLIDKKYTKKIIKVSEYIGIVFSGLQSDYRILCNLIFKKIEGYENKIGKIYIEDFIFILSREIQEFTIKPRGRPLGLLLLCTGLSYDRKSKLFSLEPSGSFQELKVAAVGKNYSESLVYLNRRYEDSLEDNLISIISGQKEFAGADDPENVEVGVLTDEGFKILDIEEVQEVYENLRH